MARMTAQLFQEIANAAERDIAILEVMKSTTGGEDTPTQSECSAIERVQSVLRGAAVAIKGEIGAPKFELPGILKQVIEDNAAEHKE